MKVLVNSVENRLSSESKVYEDDFEIDIHDSGYFLTLRATKPKCHYSLNLIMVSGTNSKQKRAANMLVNCGQHHDISMKEKDIQYLIVNSASDRNLLYLRKFGDIRMYAERSTSDSNKKILSPDYTFSETDFSVGQEFPNILTFQSKKHEEDKFEHVLYIVAIVA